MTAHAGTAVEPRWWKQHWPAPSVLAILAAIPAVGVLVPWAAGSGARYPRLISWLAIFALLLVLVLVLGKALTGMWRGVLVDERNRMSTARLQLTLWTLLVLSAYLSAVLANAALHADNPLLISVPQTLWAAMVVSTASLAAAPLALHGLKEAKKLAGHTRPEHSQWRDLVMGEETANKNAIDLAKLQMILVTIVLVAAYGAVVGYAFHTGRAKVDTLPKVNDAFAILLAISHGGYIAKKWKPKPKS